MAFVQKCAAWVGVLGILATMCLMATWMFSGGQAAPASMSAFKRADGLNVTWGTAAVTSDKGSCSGAFVGQDAVLTAAHCVKDQEGSLRVFAEYRTSPAGAATSSGICAVTSVHFPEEYRAKRFAYDYAVLGVSCKWVGEPVNYRKVARYEGGTLTGVLHRADAHLFSDTFMAHGEEISQSRADRVKGCVWVGVTSCVEALAKRGPLEGVIRSSVAVTPGSSGGPVLDGTGAVVAVVAGYDSDEKRYSLLRTLDEDALGHVRDWIRLVDPESTNG